MISNCLQHGVKAMVGYQMIEVESITMDLGHLIVTFKDVLSIVLIQIGHIHKKLWFSSTLH